MQTNYLNKLLLGLLLFLSSASTLFAQSNGYNPENPSEPSNPYQLLNYKVSVVTNIDGAGVVTGTGAYQYGTSISLKATANNGYKFLYWRKNTDETPYSTYANTTFVIGTTDVVFTAVFEKLKEVSLCMNNDACGYISGGGLFGKGSTVSLSATENPGYKFNYWIKKGDLVPYSTESSCTYIMGDEDVCFEAVYVSPPKVTLVQNNMEAGSVNYRYAFAILEGNSEVNDVIVGNGTSTSNVFPFGNYYRYSTTECIYTPSEIGKAGKIRSISYNVGSASSISPSINIYLGYKSSGKFSGSSDYVKVDDLSLVYSGTVTIGKNLGWETFTLSTPFEYNGKDNLVIVVTKNYSSYTQNLKYKYSTGKDQCLYRQSDSNTSYASVSTTSNFSLASTKPNVKFNIESNTYVYDKDKVYAKVSASVNPVFRFKYWLKNNENTPFSTELSFDYLLTNDVTFTGVFAYDPSNPAEPTDPVKQAYYSVKVTLNDTEAGIVLGEGKYKYGSEVNISTSPKDGYEFVKWQKDNEDYSTNASFSYKVVAEDINFTAIYKRVGDSDLPKPDTHTLNLISDDVGCCTFNMPESSLLEEGENFSVTASPCTDQRFVGWYIDGVCVGTLLTYSAQMGTSDINLTAKCVYSPESIDDPSSDLFPEETPYLLGDVNEDGVVDIYDVRVLSLRLVKGNANKLNKKLTDINRDGVITIVDLAKLISLLKDDNNW